jgi:rod shape determining protein RodA
MALVGLGSLLVWSATRQRMLDADLDPQAFLKRHLINAVIGLTLASVATLVDYRSLQANVPVVYVLSLGGLVAVLTPLGSTINGAHSWIVLGGGFQVQPAELAKVALVVGMAMLLADVRDGERGPRDGDVVLALLLAAVPMALIMLQPDLGTVLVLVFIVLGVLGVSGRLVQRHSGPALSCWARTPTAPRSPSPSHRTDPTWCASSCWWPSRLRGRN